MGDIARCYFAPRYHSDTFCLEIFHSLEANPPSVPCDTDPDGLTLEGLFLRLYPHSLGGDSARLTYKGPSPFFKDSRPRLSRQAIDVVSITAYLGLRFYRRSARAVRSGCAQNVPTTPPRSDMYFNRFVSMMYATEELYILRF